MSNRRSRIERSSSSNRAPDTQSDELRRQARAARTPEIPSQERERLDRALKSTFKDPDDTISMFSPRRGDKQDELRVHISHFSKEVSKTKNVYDKIQAIKELLKAQSDLTSSRLMIYEHATPVSLQDESAKKRTEMLLNASKKVKELEKTNSQLVKDIERRVDLEMSESELSTQLTKAKNKHQTAWEQSNSINTSEPSNIELFSQAATDFQTAKDGLKDAQTAYDTTANAKKRQYLLQSLNEHLQATEELYKIENVHNESFHKDKLADYTRQRLYWREPPAREQIIQEFGRDSEHFASALLLKYPKDQVLYATIQRIRSDHSGQLTSLEGQSDEPGEIRWDGIRTKADENDAFAAKRIALQELSSQKWREMREKQLWPEASEDKDE